MRVSFYAPLKPPDHAVPSGDRRVARLLMAALERAGHQVQLASRFRSVDLAGDPAAQARIALEAGAEAARVVAVLGPAPPDLWFTYHCYYKAPDLIGPAVADALRIPYVIHEPSYASKRAGGPWDRFHGANCAAIARADLLLCPTRLDLASVTRIAAPQRAHYLAPYLDTGPFAGIDRELARREAASALGLSPAVPWLLAVGMMRSRDKLESYRRLGAALPRLTDRPWRLIVVGDGEARNEVEQALAPIADRVVYAGAVPLERLTVLYTASDLLVWPAAGEAYGMAFLEAAAAGLPAIAGNVRGVPEVVIHEHTGLLVPEGDATAFAAAVRRLLDDPGCRSSLARGARDFAVGERGLDAAAARIDALLRGLVPR
ncbi:glycosyltransferase family 4 protein [Desertibaculum subflavum]|uniref:glycosyltransferase family 4 protein n=1 Tax=Desertibaculum subflavum TaxID=2268458 RepID=UPI000E6688DC